MTKIELIDLVYENVLNEKISTSCKNDYNLLNLNYSSQSIVLYPCVANVRTYTRASKRYLKFYGSNFHILSERLYFVIEQCSSEVLEALMYRCV